MPSTESPRGKNWLPSASGHPAPIVVSIAQYEQSLTDLEREQRTPTRLLEVLLRREHVAGALANELASTQSLEHLRDLDSRLRSVASRIPGSDWHAWRQALTPSPNRWWWRLDERGHLPLMILTGVILTVSLSLVVEIIQRLWSGGPDWLTTVVAVLSIVFTGSPLLRRGRALAEWLFERVSPRTALHREQVMCMMAATGLLLMLVFRFLALPPLALYYNNQGWRSLRSGQLTQSRYAFQRAVGLNPDYAEAYYNLAEEYVRVGSYDEARSLYNQALEADHTLDVAYNGLGYVLTLQGKPEQAIPVVYSGLALARDDLARVALWSNLGNAYVVAGRFAEAEEALGEALQLNPREATAHCALGLIGQTLEESEDITILHWENCLRYADLTDPRGQELAAVARAHLKNPLQEKP